jgi:hypothetical protein
LDLKQAEYLQLAFANEAKNLTASIVHQGLYLFKRMLSDLLSAFQKNNGFSLVGL